MFKFKDGDPNQLNLYKQFKEDKDNSGELKNQMPDIEDQEREEQMINETLTREEWEAALQEKKFQDLANKADYEDYLAWDRLNRGRINKKVDEINAEKELAELKSEPDDPGREYHGRFAEIAASQRRKRK
jgi:hypothetical protein